MLNAFQRNKAPEDEPAKKLTHDLEMCAHKIVFSAQEDTAQELYDLAAKTQDILSGH